MFILIPESLSPVPQGTGESDSGIKVNIQPVSSCLCTAGSFGASVSLIVNLCFLCPQ